MPAPERRPAVIVDVDGTLCDVRSIRHFVERPPGVERWRANFHRFHAASADCPPFAPVVRLVGALAAADYAVVVVTAREGIWRELTERWLAEHAIAHDTLLMRRERDYRADAVVKADILAAILRDFEPRLAIDDRDSVLEVWAAASIPTVKVGADGELSAVRWPGRFRDPQIREIVDAVR